MEKALKLKPMILCLCIQLLRGVALAASTIYYANKNSTALLACPYIYAGKTSRWYGPPNFTPYSIGNVTNFKLPHEDRIGVVLTSSNRQYNLQISNVERNDSGQYKCSGNERNLTKTFTYDLRLAEMPDGDPTIYYKPSRPIKENDTITLSCSVTGGKPLAVISWDCDGAAIVKNESSGNTSLLSCQLTVSRTDNNKKCTCIATHLAWAENKTSDLELHILYPPEASPVIEQTPSREVFAGGKTKLTCKVTGGNPLPELSWNCNGTRTNDTSGNTASYSIELTVDQTDNDRICDCLAIHPVASYRPNVTHRLIVYYAPDTYPVVTQTPEREVFAGNKTTLRCTVKGGNPLPFLSWNCTGNSSNTTSGDTASNSLELTVNKTYNNIICACSATHLVQSYRPTVTHRLIVYYAPEVFPVIEQMPSREVIAGNNTTLTCKVTGGNPLPVLSWNCTGTSSNTTSGDTASYSVELTVNKNYNGRICACSAMHLVQSYRPTVTHRLIVYYAPEVFPVIEQTPSREIIAGDNTTLTCKVTGGNPLAVLSWNCTGTSSNTTSGDTASYSVELTVNKTYNERICACSATHRVQSYRPTVTHRLIVYYAPEKKPVVTQVPYNYTVEGHNTNLTCTVTGGNPLPVLSWDCDGVQTNESYGNTISTTVDITVHKVDHNRKCNCSVAHPVREYRPVVSITLVVHYKPSIEYFNLTGNGNVTENQTVVLQCAVDSLPLPNIIWTFNRTLDTLQRNKSVLQSSYTIKKAKCSQSGTYQCLAENKLGNKFSKTSQEKELLVSCGPRRDDKKQSSKSIIGVGKESSLNITFSIIAFPAPLVYWTFVSNITGAVERIESYNIFGGFQHVTYLIKENVTLNDFGLYTLHVSNGIGNIYNETFDVVPQRPPFPPSDVSVSCGTRSFNITWKSGNNGGDTQTFKIFWGKSQNEMQPSNAIPDPGEKNYRWQKITNVKSNTQYFMLIQSTNGYGNANSTASVNCTTEQDIKETSISAAVLGGALGSVSAAIFIAVTFLCVFLIRHRNSKSAAKSESRILSKEEGEYEDGLKDNILYESAGPNFPQKSNGVGVKYSEVQRKEEKNKRFKCDISETSLYTAVNKTQSKSKSKDEIYENVTKTKEAKTKERTPDENKDKSPQNRKNNDGLLYADLVFNPLPKGAKFVIHGLEDKTVYAQVDTSQKIEPLPDSEDEETTEKQ